MTNVLVVEDDTDIRNLLVETLLDMGLQVTEAGDGGMGLHKAITEGPDIILLDLMMPVMNGFQVLDKLQDNPVTRWITVIMVSAKGQEEDVGRAVKAGAWGFVTKPWEMGELEATITRAQSQIETQRPDSVAPGDGGEGQNNDGSEYVAADKRPRQRIAQGTVESPSIGPGKRAAA